jgi:hypothetical protein
MYSARLPCVVLFLLHLSAPSVLASPSHDVVAYISEPAFASKLNPESAPWAASVTWLCMRNVHARFSLHVSAISTNF